jgi:hypothetical protein
MTTLGARRVQAVSAGERAARILSAHPSFPAVFLHVARARKDGMMRRQILAVSVLGLMVAVGSAACDDKGPMQKAGEKVDRATDQDKIIGKGPLEKAGKNVDNAVKELKK